MPGKPSIGIHSKNSIFEILIYFFKADPEPQHAGDNQIEMDKRFSMNFLDTLGPQKRFSMNFHDTVSPHKRFSMNYRDMLGPLNKRFSMNFLDTVGHGRPHKRFSMNYFDTIGHKEHRPRKRFSMNFMDVIGDSRNRYFAGKPGRNSGSSNTDMSNKRSDEKDARARAQSLLNNLDAMANFLLDRYTFESVCQKKDFRELFELRAFLTNALGHELSIHCNDPTLSSEASD